MNVAKKLQGPFRPNAKLTQGQVVDARTAVPTRYVDWEDGSHSWEPDHTPFHIEEVPNKDEPLNVLGRPMPGSEQANQQGQEDDIALDAMKARHSKPPGTVGGGRAKKSGLNTYGKQRASGGGRANGG